MSKVKMPEPVVLRTVMPNDYRYGHIYGYTGKQMEAYAEARAREVLEYAAKVCEARIGTGDPGIDTEDADTEAKECAMAIRALIKNQ